MSRPPKKPIVREIEAITDEGWHLALRVMDSGGVEHAAMARLTSPDGTHADLLGKLSGIQFEQPRPVGAPSKFRRDVAVLCAREYYVAQGHGKSKATELVISLWEKLGLRGITDASHVRTRIREALKAAPSLQSCHPLVIFDTENEQRIVCMIERVSMLQVFDDKELTVIFRGWVYLVGDDVAHTGEFIRVTTDGDRDALRDDVARLERELRPVIPWLAKE